MTDSIRTTVRDLAREPDVDAALASAGVDPGERLTVLARSRTAPGACSSGGT